MEIHARHSRSISHTFFKRTLAALTASCLVFAASQTAWAAPEDYVVDDVHTSVDFEVAHLVFSTVHGTFRKFGGEIKFDKDKIENLNINAWVQVDTVDTKNEKRDGHLKGDDFFNAQKFPKILLKSKSVKKESDKRLKVLTDFTLRGVTKPVTFDVEYKGSVKAFGKERIGYKATAVINRKDFGVNFNNLADSVPIVGDDITLIITGQAILKKDL